MKKILLLLALCAMVFVACSDDDDKDDDKDAQTPWEIKMKIKTDKELSVCPRLGLVGSLDSIDWGDGFVDIEFKVTEDKGVLRFSSLTHSYNNGEYDIIMKGKGTLMYMTCEGMRLAELNTSLCPNLIELNCYSNQLISLVVGEKLQSLDCSNNKLTSLDVSKNSELQSLDCPNNKLTSLDVSKCPNLIELNCYSNQLISLVVGERLQSLDCYDNKLTSLDVSKNTKLISLTCAKNNFDDNAMNAIYNGLPNRSKESDAGIIYLNDDDARGNTSIAKNKNWKIE